MGAVVPFAKFRRMIVRAVQNMRARLAGVFVEQYASNIRARSCVIVGSSRYRASLQLYNMWRRLCYRINAGHHHGPGSTKGKGCAIEW